MIRITILLFWIFAAACSNPPPNLEIQPVSTPKRKFQKDIPDDSWVKLFFDGSETETIDENGKIKSEKRGGLDEFASINGLSVLREDVLPENDLEVRVWVGFGLYGIDGFILKRNSGNWSATGLKQMICHAENRGRIDLQAPKSGWESAWKKLVDAKILILPDSSKLNYKGGVTDGKGFVVETNSDYLYRTYHYGNPNYVKLKEAEQMVKIGQIIAEEFGLESFSLKTNGCGKNE
jgi:hypothetical protein